MAIRDMKFCHDCLRYRRERDEARREVKRLKDENRKLRTDAGRAHRTINEKPFGSSTSSAREVVKSNSSADNQARKGGARHGHNGHGRRKTPPASQQRTETVNAPKYCPECGGRLAAPSVRTRTLISCEPPRPVTRTVRLEEAWCCCCRKTVRPQVPDAFPYMLLDNRALAYVAVEHYLHGQTLGRLARITGISKGTLTNAMHWLADLIAPALSGLERELRMAEVIFADETVWRNDGQNGYAWMFRTADIVI
jgi:transposase